jgi:RNA polymerase sigma factor (sigma-70 family)
MDPAAKIPPGGERGDWRLPDACGDLLRGLFAESAAERWHLSFSSFAAALSRSANKRFGESPSTFNQIQEYLATLHVRDLALACACAEARSGWNDFVEEYRSYLRTAAAAILRRSVAVRRRTADSLFADLTGCRKAKPAPITVPLFPGRSSLKTWLRAVLAQRHIDSIRSGKKFDSLDDFGDDGETRRVREPSKAELPANPHREMYLQRFREALALALASLDARDRSRLRFYYAEDHTLAEIGKTLGEHESSVSRNLERIRKELRGTVEGLLRAGKTAANGGPSARDSRNGRRTIDLSLHYAAEDAAIDLDKLFQSRKTRKITGPDRVCSHDGALFLRSC